MNWPALLIALRTAEQQFVANAPLEADPAPEGGSIGDTLAAVQPAVAKVNALIVSRPGAITAGRTMLAEFSRQGQSWAAELDAILATVPGAVATADKDLPVAIGMLKEFAPAATGIQGDHNDPMFKDQ